MIEKRDETTSLISAGRALGTSVYNTSGDSLGEINNVMIDKRSGKIAYAVMSLGGFLAGATHHTYHYDAWTALAFTQPLADSIRRWRHQYGHGQAHPRLAFRRSNEKLQRTRGG
ncbi:MAG: PRC-barrel domain-containing protein [Rhizobiales bacterium]|nr:PRC-barrel domain-containing protein [Hyphomicrobiales bacterium]